ncbi:MAG TPA: hypothetical protein VGI45_21985 [Terracidiphilus sp.]|jgi:hypothetical protein
MLKYAIGLALVLGCAFVIARRDEYAANQSAPPSAQSDKATVAAQQDENHPQKHVENTGWDSPSGHIFHAAFKWPEGITVWAIVLTLLAIAEQTSATHKAAEATEDAVVASRDSLKVQEAEFVQWLDIGEWGIHYDRSVYRLERTGHEVSNHPGEMKVRLSFPLVNNTTRPLFIKSVRTLLTIGPEKTIKVFVTDESIPVPPKDEYKVLINMVLSPDHVTHFAVFQLFIESAVQVKFSNALKKSDEASFRRLFTCNAFDGSSTVTKGHIAKEENQDTGHS